MLFARLHGRDSLHLATHGGFAAGVVLTVPPFPYRHGYEELSKGMPVYLRPFAPHTGSALRLAERARLISGLLSSVGPAAGGGDVAGRPAGHCWSERLSRGGDRHRRHACVGQCARAGGRAKRGRAESAIPPGHWTAARGRSMGAVATLGLGVGICRIFGRRCRPTVGTRPRQEEACPPTAPRRKPRR